MEFKFKVNEDENDEELDRLLDEMAKAYNNLMVYILKRDFEVDVQILDDDHIVIDGEVMDAEQFSDWLDEQYEDNYEEEPNERYYEA